MDRASPRRRTGENTQIYEGTNQIQRVVIAKGVQIGFLVAGRKVLALETWLRIPTSPRGAEGAPSGNVGIGPRVEP
jgi:hypothetical protein